MKNNLLIALLFSSICAKAQDASDFPVRKWSLDFGGSVGVFIPFDQVKDSKTAIGSNAITTLQLNYREHFFTRLQFGQTTVDFKYRSTFPTINSDISAKANSTNLGLVFGYQRSFRRLQPYVFAGAGASFIDAPTAFYDLEQNMVNYRTLSGTHLQVIAGAGLNYRLSKTFILFLEGQAATIPDIPKNSATHLSGISALIGIKAPL